jgi:hypothetical protein
MPMDDISENEEEEKKQSDFIQKYSLTTHNNKENFERARNNNREQVKKELNLNNGIEESK